MSTMTRSCPFCNADSPIPAGTRDGQRVWCVRCGEAFPYRGPTVSESTIPLQQNLEPPAPPSNRKVALLVLGVMALTATLGIVYAVATVHFRRNNDRPTKSTEEEITAVRTVAPSDLAGLRYLPPDSNVVAGLHVAELLQEPNGRRFLARFNPAELLPRDPGARVTDNLEKWTGLKLDELDHLVLGLNVEGRLTPRITLVAQTRRRYDPAAIRAALKANATPEPGGREVYRFKPDKPLDALWPEALLWLADERTVIVAVPPEDRKTALPEPAVGSEHFPKVMQGLLKAQLGSIAPAWVAGHVEDWNKTSLKLLLLTMPAAEREPLGKLRAFTGSVRMSPELTVQAMFQTDDAKSAERMEKYLTPAAEDRKPLRLLGSRPEAAEVARELTESRKVTRNENWVTLQAKARLETLQKALAD